MEGRGDVPGLSAALVISAGGIREGKGCQALQKVLPPGALDPHRGPLERRWVNEMALAQRNEPAGVAGS